MLATEMATGVLVALVRTLRHPFITKREPERVVYSFKRLLLRGLPKERPEDVIGVLVDSLTQLYVFLSESSAEKVLRSFERFPNPAYRAFAHYGFVGGLLLDLSN